MKIAVPKETFAGERRIALIPDQIPLLRKKGFDVMIEAGAGAEAGITDEQFKSKEAEVTSDRSALFESGDIVLQVRTYGCNPEGNNDIDAYRTGQVVIGHGDPLTNPEAYRALADRGVSTIAMELIPRITRAQTMDVLSSMATIAGYKAVLLAMDTVPKMFPMMMTAAGTIAPARVFVVGAGVAGLQAIATAKRNGAVVQAYDIRPAVKEQVESLGAQFVEMELEAGQSEDKGGYAKEMNEEFYRKQRELMTRVVSESDVVITTAAIPGKKAPLLVTAEMVKAMPAGSVLVDLAAERGGNCELTKPDEVTQAHDVNIIGTTNLPATVPYHASQMYGKNLCNYLNELVSDGELNFDLENQVIADTLITHDGKITNSRVRELLGMPVAEEPVTEEKASDE